MISHSFVSVERVISLLFMMPPRYKISLASQWVFGEKFRCKHLFSVNITHISHTQMIRDLQLLSPLFANLTRRDLEILSSIVEK